MQLEEWLNVEVAVYVPCPHCTAARSYDPYLFSLKSLQDAVAGGSSVVYCRSINPVQIYAIAPDISMESASLHSVSYSDVQVGQVIWIEEAVHKGLAVVLFAYLGAFI